MLLAERLNKSIKTTDKIKGFSLMELVIVLLIVGIMAIFALPFYQSTPNINMQADELAADILYTQSLSMSTGQPHHLKYLTNTTYEIRNITTGNVVKNVTFQPGISIKLNGFLGYHLIAFDGLGMPYLNEPIIFSNQFGPAYVHMAAAYIELTDTAGNFATDYIMTTTGFVYVYYGTYQAGFNSNFWN